jgi:hypothetical protein
MLRKPHNAKESNNIFLVSQYIYLIFVTISPFPTHDILHGRDLNHNLSCLMLFISTFIIWAGIAQSVQRLATGRMGGKIFRTRPDRPWGPTRPLFNGYRVSLPVVKWPGCGFHYPLSSRAEVKERAGVNFYSPSGSSWPDLVWTLLFTLLYFILLYFYNAWWRLFVNADICWIIYSTWTERIPAIQLLKRNLDYNAQRTTRSGGRLQQ